jgi:hypothetical protein
MQIAIINAQSGRRLAANLISEDFPSDPLVFF